MTLLVMPPLGVEAVARLLGAPEPLDPPPLVPLDARTANLSLFIVVGAPDSGPSSSTPSQWWCGTRQKVEGGAAEMF